jgi:hypothetical protein
LSGWSCRPGRTSRSCSTSRAGWSSRAWGASTSRTGGSGVTCDSRCLTGWSCRSGRSRSASSDASGTCRSSRAYGRGTELYPATEVTNILFTRKCV